jgi:hypothetical protein
LVPQENKTLRVLNLEYNQIGDVGAAALGEGVAVSSVARVWWLVCLYLPNSPSPEPTSFCDAGAVGEYNTSGAVVE